MESMQDFQAEIDQSFRKINEGDVLTGTVIGMSDDAVMLDLKYYAPGIIRKEDYSEDPNFNIRRDVKVGEEISAVVIGTDDGNGNLLLSRKEAREGSAWDWFQEAMDQKQGLKVKIAEAVKAGVICYPNGIRAFIPASRLSLSFVDEKDLPSYVGKEMEVRVITCDKKAGKLVLSAREILKEQADRERAEKVSNVKVGLVTEGNVESLQ
ncbi:MAG: S1 RNA-binding domain-containing protein, partial [Lachnospiraceae bacterium]|nr:S1 RNA-binding domain-containing protein [Lachnospiraceae bacterium]